MCKQRDRTMKKANIAHQPEQALFQLNSFQLSSPIINWLSHVSLFQAQRYQTLVDELHQIRLQLSLAELYRNERAIGALSSNLHEKQQAASAKTNKLNEEETQKVKMCKKEHGRLTREQQHIEKENRCVCVYSGLIERENVYWLFNFGNKHNDLKILILQKRKRKKY